MIQSFDNNITESGVEFKLYGMIIGEDDEGNEFIDNNKFF